MEVLGRGYAPSHDIIAAFVCLLLELKTRIVGVAFVIQKNCYNSDTDNGKVGCLLVRFPDPLVTWGT